MMTGDAGMPPKTDTITADSMDWFDGCAKDFRRTRRGRRCRACNSIGTGRARISIRRARRRCDCSGLRILCSSNFARNISSITVYDDADSRGWRDKLWDKDVCELFVQSDPSQPRKYQEFEVAPNGNWIDLDIDLDGGEHHGKRDLTSGLKRRVSIDEAAKTWRAVLALPMKSLVAGSIRFIENLAREFLSRRRAERAEILCFVAADEDAVAAISCAGGFWAARVCRREEVTGDL